MSRPLLVSPLRMKAVQTPIIPVIAEMVRNNPGTISLGQGVVYYPPPPQAADAITSFFSQAENHKYQAVEGIPPLLDAIGAKLKAENGISAGSRSLPGRGRVVVTAGGNMAFMNAVLALTDPGDEIVLQTPYYFNHEMAVVMAGCHAVLVDTDERYQLRPEAIRAAVTPRTRAIVTVSPNNPSGAVYPEAALREINAICRERGIYHISDEAYENFTYNGTRHFSPGSIPESEAYTLSLYSLSKAYGFASWRIGYMVVPENLFESIKKIQDTILICPPVISQYAAVGTLSVGNAYCRDKLAVISTVRAMLLDELKAVSGFCTVPEPDGAFYIFLKVNMRLDAMELTERLIREHKVAVIPGHAFGMTQACYLRIAFGSLQADTAKEGIKRLVQGLKKIVCG